MIYLDTHVVAWLYAGLTNHLSAKAVDLIESNRLLISPMVQLEIQYLKEIERINADPALIIESLDFSIGLEICRLPFIQVITESISHTWTRDPFDRLIVAQSQAGKAPLLTKDQTILNNYPQAVW